MKASLLNMVPSAAVSTTAGIFNPLILMGTMREIPVFSVSAFRMVISQRLGAGMCIFGGGWPVFVSGAEQWPSCPALSRLTVASLV